jgi:hypothetical protein
MIIGIPKNGPFAKVSSRSCSVTEEALSRFRHPDHALGLRERNRFQQDRVNDTEHGRVDADAESQQSEGDSGESRIAVQTARPRRHQHPSPISSPSEPPPCAPGPRDAGSAGCGAEALFRAGGAMALAARWCPEHLLRSRSLSRSRPAASISRM